MAESKASPLGSRSQSPNTASDSGSPTLRKRSYTDMASPPESDKPDTSYKDHSGHGADAVVHDPSLVSQTSTPNDEQHENADDADDAHHPDQDDSSEHEEDSVLEPDAPLKPFDWHDFDAEYHEMIKNKKDEEMKIYADFEDLCQLFSVWAETSRSREVERSFKRLKTQSAYVKNEEHVSNTQRQHYVNVVAAFRSALSLLGT